MVAGLETQRLISLSLGKMAQSRSQRGGVNLHKNLLVATVLHKARTAYMIESYSYQQNLHRQRVLQQYQLYYQQQQQSPQHFTQLPPSCQRMDPPSSTFDPVYKGQPRLLSAVSSAGHQHAPTASSCQLLSPGVNAPYLLPGSRVPDPTLRPSHPSQVQPPQLAQNKENSPPHGQDADDRLSHSGADNCHSNVTDQFGQDYEHFSHHKNISVDSKQNHNGFIHKNSPDDNEQHRTSTDRRNHVNHSSDYFTQYSVHIDHSNHLTASNLLAREVQSSTDPTAHSSLWQQHLPLTSSPSPSVTNSSSPPVCRVLKRRPDNSATSCYATDPPPHKISRTSGPEQQLQPPDSRHSLHSQSTPPSDTPHCQSTPPPDTPHCQSTPPSDTPQCQPLPPPDTPQLTPPSQIISSLDHSEVALTSSCQVLSCASSCMQPDLTFFSICRKTATKAG